MIKDPKQVSKDLDVCIDDLNTTLEELRPYLAMDGGDIQVVGMDGLSVFVRLVGACEGCSQAGMTLQYGVEDLFRNKIHPDIEVVPIYEDLD